MNLLLRFLIYAVAFYLIAKYVPGIHAHGFTTALIMAAVFGLVNAIIRPIVVLLTLPLTIVTLGLFLIVINALMFWLAARIVPGFHVSGFIPALIGAIIMMFVGLLANSVLKGQKASLLR